MNLPNLFDLQSARSCRTRRSSSYDRAGGNIDFCRIPAGGTLVILDVAGPGMVTHLCFALTHMDYNYLRTLLLRAWWDGEAHPSIECPLGDFFGVGHAMARGYSSLVMDMTRGSGQRGEATGVNCYLPMPFGSHARIEVVNESLAPCQACYYTVNWLQVPREQVADAGRFHASWRRENPKRTTPVTETSQVALTYADDNRSWLPLPCNNNYPFVGSENPTPPEMKGIVYLLPYLGAKNVNDIASGATKVFFCPSGQIKFVENWLCCVLRSTSYMQYCGYTYPVINDPTYVNSASTLRDNPRWLLWSDYACVGAGMLLSNHTDRGGNPDGANCLFLDSHVEWVNAAKLTVQISKVGNTYYFPSAN